MTANCGYKSVLYALLFKTPSIATNMTKETGFDLDNTLYQIRMLKLKIWVYMALPRPF